MVIDEIISEFGEIEVWEKLQTTIRPSYKRQINTIHTTMDDLIWHQVYGEIETITFRKLNKDVS